MKHDILNPGFELTLRPMRYPQFYQRYKDLVKNTWTVEEVDFSQDTNDLSRRMVMPERHLINRLVAFFATGDTIVANNLVLNLYRHINSVEFRLAAGEVLAQECVHVDMYLRLLDSYIPDHDERSKAFAAIENIPSIHKKAEFCFKWMEQMGDIQRIETHEQRRQMLLTVIAFANCVEGIFFFGAFAYVYWFRARGLLPGLAAATNYIFKDESSHISLYQEVISVIRQESPELFDDVLQKEVTEMIEDAVDCEAQFAADVIGEGLIGLSLKDMRTYLEYVADQRFVQMGYPKRYNVSNPFDFMELQDVQELANFFERRVTAYQVGVEGRVEFGQDF